MVTTPSGPISLPLSLLRESLAGSSSFRTWVGAATAAIAKASVFYGRAPGATAPPFAVIYHDTFNRSRNDDILLFQTDAVIELLLRETIAAGTEDWDAYIHINNIAGSIITDMEQFSRTAGYLAIEGTSIPESAYIVQPDEDEAQTVGAYAEIIINVAWMSLV